MKQDAVGNLVLLKACTKLTKDGLAFFVVPSSFMIQNRSKSVYANLARFAIFVDAVLSLPQHAFYPVTSIETVCVILRRSKPEHLFVAELSGDEKQREAMLGNLKKRKPGKEVAIGALVDATEFRGYRSLVTSRRIRDLTKAMELRPTKLDHLATAINLTSSKTPDFTERPNAVYLPLIGHRPAVTSTSEFSLKPHNYVQIILDLEKALASYVARLFSTPLGHLLRQQAVSGSIIPKISKSRPIRMEVFLPPLQVQMRTVEVDTKAGELINELRELHKRVWSGPNNLDDVATRLACYEQKEELPSWLEVLPFPLASILWTYYARKDYDKKAYENLLHFFEALAEFLAIVLISAFQNDPELYRKEAEVLRSTISSNEINRSSFGTWVKIAQRLAKTGRRLLSGKADQEQRCKDIFKTRLPEVLEMLFSKKIMRIIQQTNELRNMWTGHGGIVGDDEKHKRHVILGNLLSETRHVFGRNWENYEMIRVGECRIISGIYHSRVERIMGVRTPFKSTEVSTSEPMDYGELYLLSPTELKPVKLWPLIKVMSSPKTAQNACYFYNPVEKNNIRFISYHFEPEAEIISKFPNTAKTLKEIFQNGTINGDRSVSLRKK